FDLGNVLIFFDWSLPSKRLAEMNPKINFDFKKFFSDKIELIKNFEKGKIESSTFMGILESELQTGLPEKELAKIFSEIFTPNRLLLEKLGFLERNYSLYLLSNTNILHRDFGWGNYDFLKYFKKLFLSYEIGNIKPEKEIFEFVEKQIELKHSEFIYIDDILEYVETARAKGWNAIQFKNNEQLIDEMKKFGIE
ncbi:MAG: HAD family phosphatase, partial [Ignavibacteria bacterium]|nr:HAD family phosphatase [Ignavibacteria bacterium]